MIPNAANKSLLVAARTAAVLAVCAALDSAAAISRITIELPGALGVAFGSPAQRVVRLELFLDGTDIESVLVTAIARNPALAGWDARDIVSTLKWKNGTLSGVVTATIVPAGPGEAAPWKCIVDAHWRDGALKGRADSFMGDTSMAGSEFDSRLERLPESRGDDGFVELILPGHGEEMGVHAGFEFRDGKAVSSVSFGPLIHPVWQAVDASGLELKRGKLSGKVSWTPIEAGEDGVASASQPMEIKANLRDGFADVERGGVSGVVVLSPVPRFPETADVELAFDAPLVGGERWRRRVVVRLVLARNTSRATAFFNGRADPDWNAVIDGAAVERRGKRIGGTIDATVASATVQPGFYRIRFTGSAIGNWIAGTFESELAGAKAGKGQFTGWAVPAGR